MNHSTPSAGKPRTWGRILGWINQERETSMEATEPQYSTATKLTRISELSRSNPNLKFECLMHHFNKECLMASFNMLDGKKAVGANGVSKEEYGMKLEERLEDLLARMKRMAYRPGPVRQVLIPKEGKSGATRPLGISNFEDKLVQSVTKQILESIYDPIFLNCSYGFRPGRGCHDAIKDLRDYLFRNDTETVIDVDLANFFGTIDHKNLEGFLREKISDERFIRYLIRMFKAGVLSEGELTYSDEGVPQGSCCSPILANVMAHHVIDRWFEETVKQHCRGRAAMFRYADDLVICCNNASDAPRIKRALAQRLSKYKLRVNEDKTKLVPFSKVKLRQGIKQGTFDFLGFTFYLRQSKAGQIIPQVRTSGKRLRAKLKNVNQWVKGIRNLRRTKEIWQTFCRKLQGHIAYYGVTFNLHSVNAFTFLATRIIFKWLNRRSQRRSFSWERFQKFLTNYPLPKVKVYVPLY